MEEKGVKELLELVKGLKELGLVVKAVLKDGKINLDDLGALTGLLAKQQDLVNAFQGLSDVDEELKDLSLDEILLVIKELGEAAKAVKAA
jgi:hypothetical protein